VVQKLAVPTSTTTTTATTNNNSQYRHTVVTSEALRWTADGVTASHLKHCWCS